MCAKSSSTGSSYFEKRHKYVTYFGSMKAIILAGGKGENLWPISRNNTPKQFSKLLWPRSLFQQTLELLIQVIQPKDIHAVVPKEYRFFVKTQSFEVIKTETVSEILEDEAKGTGIATLKTVKYLIEKGIPFHENIVILNSDLFWFEKDLAKLIEGFKDKQLDKIKCVFSDKLRGAKDFIEKGGEIEQDIYEIKSFSQNRLLKHANVGVYISRLSVLVDVFEKFFGRQIQDIEIPERNMSIEEVLSNSKGRLVGVNYSREVIDINSIADLKYMISRLQGDKNKSSNIGIGDVCISDSSRNMVISTKRLVVLNNVKDINVVETPDVVYISKDNVDNKKVLDMLSGRDEIEYGTTSYRPWGSYTIIDKGPNFQIKRIMVNPGESLSLQLHYHRSEHWIVVRGTAKVTVDDKVIFLKENESTFIPKTSKHRLENPGKLPLEIIEIQIGDYLGEDDIVRFEDVYGR